MHRTLVGRRTQETSHWTKRFALVSHKPIRMRLLQLRVYASSKQDEKNTVLSKNAVFSGPNEIAACCRFKHIKHEIQHPRPQRRQTYTYFVTLVPAPYLSLFIAAFHCTQAQKQKHAQLDNTRSTWCRNGHKHAPNKPEYSTIYDLSDRRQKRYKPSKKNMLLK